MLTPRSSRSMPIWEQTLLSLATAPLTDFECWKVIWSTGKLAARAARERKAVPA